MWARLRASVNLRALKHRRSQFKPKAANARGGVASSHSERVGRQASRDVAVTPPAALGHGRRTLFRIAAMVLVPLVLLGALEAALRLAGYGYPTSFFKPIRIGGEEFLVENDKFGWRFFLPESSPSPNPVVVAARKTAAAHTAFLVRRTESA